jgi:hypothetical protein
MSFLAHQDYESRSRDLQVSSRRAAAMQGAVPRAWLYRHGDAARLVTLSADPVTVKLCVTVLDFRCTRAGGISSEVSAEFEYEEPSFVAHLMGYVQAGQQVPYIAAEQLATDLAKEIAAHRP